MYDKRICRNMHVFILVHIECELGCAHQQDLVSERSGQTRKHVRFTPAPQFSALRSDFPGGQYLSLIPLCIAMDPSETHRASPSKEVLGLSVSVQAR